MKGRGKALSCLITTYLLRGYGNLTSSFKEGWRQNIMRAIGRMGASMEKESINLWMEDATEESGKTVRSMVMEYTCIPMATPLRVPLWRVLSTGRVSIDTFLGNSTRESTTSILSRARVGWDLQTAMSILGDGREMNLTAREVIHSIKDKLWLGSFVTENSFHTRKCKRSINRVSWKMVTARSSTVKYP